jgi:hypothetical protein
MNSYWYAYGYKTRAAALDALEESYALGEVSEGERPVIDSYKLFDGKTRYGIRLEGQP